MPRTPNGEIQIESPADKNNNNNNSGSTTQQPTTPSSERKKYQPPQKNQNLVFYIAPFIENKDDTSEHDFYENELHVGDEVEFSITVDKRTKEKMATDIKIIKQARDDGVIVEFKDGYGTIQSSTNNVEYFFSASHVRPNSAPVRVGAPVTFAVTVDRQLARKRAVSVIVLEVRI